MDTQQERNPELDRALERAGLRYHLVDGRALPNLAEAVANNYPYPEHRDAAARQAAEDQTFANNIDQQVAAEAPGVIAAAEALTAAAAQPEAAPTPEAHDDAYLSYLEQDMANHEGIQDAEQQMNAVAPSPVNPNVEAAQTATRLQEVRSTLNALDIQAPNMPFEQSAPVATATEPEISVAPEVNQALNDYLSTPGSMN